MTTPQPDWREELERESFFIGHRPEETQVVQTTYAEKIIEKALAAQKAEYEKRILEGAYELSTCGCVQSTTGRKMMQVSVERIKKVFSET